MGALLAAHGDRSGTWAVGIRAPTAADGSITTGHALLGGSGGAAMQLSGLQVSKQPCQVLPLRWAVIECAHP